MRSTTIYIRWSKEWFWRWLKGWILRTNFDWSPHSNHQNYRQLIDPSYLTAIEQGPPYIFNVWMKFVIRGTEGQTLQEPMLALSFALTEYGPPDRVSSKVVIGCDESLGTLLEDVYLALEKYRHKYYSLNGEPALPEATQPSARQTEQPAVGSEPLLPARASQEQWDAWFAWYYDQPWGPVSNKLRHMAELTGRAYSTVSKKHADYMTANRQ